MVCRIVKIDWENNRKRDNRVIIGLRYDSPEGKQTSYFYLKKDIRIATNFVLASNTDKTRWIVDKCINDTELRKYPFRDRFHQNERYQTFEIEMPYNYWFIKRLPSPFQKGDYSTKLRYEMPWFYRTVEMDYRIKNVIKLKSKVDEELHELKRKNHANY